MTIHKIKGEFQLECTSCGDIDDETEEDFKTLVSNAKKQGWRIYKDDDADEWLHFCPRCRTIRQ